MPLSEVGRLRIRRYRPISGSIGAISILIAILTLTGLSVLVPLYHIEECTKKPVIASKKVVSVQGLVLPKTQTRRSPVRRESWPLSARSKDGNNRQKVKFSKRAYSESNREGNIVAIDLKLRY